MLSSYLLRNVSTRLNFLFTLYLSMLAYRLDPQLRRRLDVIFGQPAVHGNLGRSWGQDAYRKQKTRVLWLSSTRSDVRTACQLFLFKTSGSFDAIRFFDVPLLDGTIVLPIARLAVKGDSCSTATRVANGTQSRSCCHPPRVLTAYGMRSSR